MRRLVLVFALLIMMVVPLVLTQQASAAMDIFAPVCDDVTRESAVCQGSAANPVSGTEGVILKVVSLLSFVIGVASVIMIILGGFKYITSNGDANAISSAKNTILYALIGVVVAVFARVIVQFVITKL